MRLRTRLILLFAALALVPLALVVPATVSSLRTTLSDELVRRADSAAAAAEALVAQRSAEVARAIEELASSVAVEEAARELHARGMSPALAPVAERLMSSRGLSVLSLLDGEGRTLSSGHLPARLLDVDPELFAAARQKGFGARALLVEVATDRGLRRVPALVAARTVEYGQARLFVVGGVLLDASLTQTLARITGAEVALEGRGTAGVPIARSGEAAEPVLERSLPVGEAARLTLRLSRSGLLRAEAGVLRGFLFLAAGGLLFAILLGVLASRRITRPVEALTAAARRLAGGEKGAQARVSAGGELGELVRTFNGMSGELERTTSKLIASERIAAWQEVARRLAHEIKNPLTPIRMSLETLSAAHRERSPHFDGLFEESAGMVLEEVERLRKIVDEFSRFARLPRPQLEVAALDVLVPNVLQLYSTPPAGIELTQSHERGVMAAVDRDQLAQVLINLVKNAAEAMPAGGTIQVRTRARPDEVTIEVEDSGPGLSPELRERIFEPYVTTKPDGSGLGLALSARICQEHGGRLEVDSPPGRGATFRVVLPR